MSHSPQAPEADPVVHTDGKVPVDSRSEAAETVLSHGGRVAAVGSNAEQPRAAASGVQRQTLDGATAIPRLIDARPRLMHFRALPKPLVDVPAARDHSEIVTAIRAKARTVSIGERIGATPVDEPRDLHRRPQHDVAAGCPIGTS